MNKYESVIIIKPNLEDGEIEGIITEITDLINQNGEVTKVDKKGINKLAYEIRKCKEGYYVVFYYETDPSFIAELERKFRITENIIKFITVKDIEN